MAVAGQARPSLRSSHCTEGGEVKSDCRDWSRSNIVVLTFHKQGSLAFGSSAASIRKVIFTFNCHVRATHDAVMTKF